MTATDEPLERFTEGGLDWVAEAPAAAIVREEIARRIDDIENASGASVLKRNMVRAVFRVPLTNGTVVVVKRYAVGGAVDWAKYTFRPSRAHEEWRVGRWLAAAGVPTAVPLAMAERRDVVLRDAALVTREIPDAVHLNAYVEAHLQGGADEDALRGALYAQLAAIVRRMHDAGLVHNDLHGGNVLVNGLPDVARIHIIDLHSVKRFADRTPPAGRRWFDLVKLLHSMRTCSTARERVEICRVYENAGEGPSGTRLTELLAAGRLSDELEPRLIAMERKRVRSRTQRCLERSSKFDATTHGGFRIHALRRVPVAALPALIRAHHATLAAGGQGVLKDARKSALTRQMLTMDGSPRAVVVKEYRSARAGDRVKNAFRRPRAIRAWIAGNGLLVRGFDAAEPLALMLRGRGPGLALAYVVMEDLGDGERLDLVALARFAHALDADERAAKRHLVSTVAGLLRHMHREGVYHADMKAVNLFVRERCGDASVVLADYDRVEFDRPVPLRRRVKNLAQLSASIPVCITVTDRLRFLCDYLANDARRRRVWKRWFRAIIDDCRQKIVVRTEPIE